MFKTSRNPTAFIPVFLYHDQKIPGPIAVRSGCGAFGMPFEESCDARRTG